MDKFGRKYVLIVQTNTKEEIEISLPFTVEFDIIRNSLSSANTSSIRIYNLSEQTRNKILKDKYDFGDIRTITLKAGYDDNPSVVFQGFISQAWSVREGVDFITQIESFDGGFAYMNAVSSYQFPAGANQATIIDTLAQSLQNYGVQKGAIGSYPGTLSRGNSYDGNTTELLNGLTGGGFYIDNGKANCLGDNEVIAGDVFELSSASGLLGTPVRENTILMFDVIFEPRLYIGQQVKLNSVTAKNYNYVYKVVGIKHRGMISETVAGTAITTVEVFARTAFNEVGPND